jgi:leucyl aminopeptidase
MQFKAKKIADITSCKTGCLAINVSDSKKLSGNAQIIDKATGGLISKLIKQQDFTAAIGNTLLVHSPSGIVAERLLLVGFGNEKQMTAALILQMG